MFVKRCLNNGGIWYIIVYYWTLLTGYNPPSVALQTWFYREYTWNAIKCAVEFANPSIIVSVLVERLQSMKTTLSVPE